LIDLYSGWFYGLILFLRFLQGIAVANIIPAVYSMIIILYNNQSSEIFVGLATANTLGVMLGPLLGEFLF
jgi:MFS family permease